MQRSKILPLASADMENEIVYKNIKGEVVLAPAGTVPKKRMSAYAIVLSEDETRFLAVKVKGIDGYMLPGGGIEPDESLIQGLAREVLEEGNCAVDLEESESFFSRETYFCDTYFNPEGDFYHCFSHVFIAKLAKEQPTSFPDSPEPITERSWLSVADVTDEQLSQFYRGFLPAIREKLEKRRSG